MIVSHRNKFLFIEIPQTGTTAIAAELRARYGGTEILRKHATYREFAREAGPDARNYFVIAGVRHPLDRLLSHYVKFKTDHNDYENAPKAAAWQRERLRWLRQTDASFADYVRRYHRKWDVRTPDPHTIGRVVDHLIRFERLSEDFNALLARLNLPPMDELPVKNQTQRNQAFESSFDGLGPLCAAVFGPWCEFWGYDVGFLGSPIPGWSRTLFNLKMARQQLR